jgi:hypothetical protein
LGEEVWMKNTGERAPRVKQRLAWQAGGYSDEIILSAATGGTTPCRSGPSRREPLGVRLFPYLIGGVRGGGTLCLSLGLRRAFRGRLGGTYALLGPSQFEPKATPFSRKRFNTLLEPVVIACVHRTDRRPVPRGADQVAQIGIAVQGSTRDARPFGEIRHCEGEPDGVKLFQGMQDRRSPFLGVGWTPATPPSAHCRT